MWFGDVQSSMPIFTNDFHGVSGLEGKALESALPQTRSSRDSQL
jgi:hypothetical protein